MRDHRTSRDAIVARPESGSSLVRSIGATVARGAIKDADHWQVSPVCHALVVPSIDRCRDRGRRDADEHLRQIGRELRDARLNADLSQDAVARAAACSRAEISRIERGASTAVPLGRIEPIASVLGLRLSLRLYPAGQPLRDAPQLALLDRLRAHLHPSLRWVPEAALPGAGDLRAWDVGIHGADWGYFYDAETRIRDVQAIQRRTALKRRDSHTDRVGLLLADTRFHRDLLRSLGAPLVEGALPESEVLRALAEGRDPGGPSVLLL